jgi:hypothetical protein
MSGRSENNGFRTPEKKRPNNGLGPESFQTPPRIGITMPKNITWAPTRPKNEKDFKDNTKIIFPKI